MDAFGYLAILISIVLGLGVTNLLTGVAALARHRARIRLYWPAPVWMVTLFLIHVQTWWAMFGLRSIERWSFGAFLVVLLQPVFLFVMAALIVPDFTETDGRLDMRAAYFRQARWFFGALLCALFASLGKNLVLTGALPEPYNLGAHIIFIAIAVLGALVAKDGLHKVLAPLGLVLLGGYIVLLFTALT